MRWGESTLTLLITESWHTHREFIESKDCLDSVMLLRDSVMLV